MEDRPQPLLVQHVTPRRRPDCVLSDEGTLGESAWLRRIAGTAPALRIGAIQDVAQVPFAVDSSGSSRSNDAGQIAGRHELRAHSRALEIHIESSQCHGMPRRCRQASLVCLR
jgi:hypothetical protein